MPDNFDWDQFEEDKSGFDWDQFEEDPHSKPSVSKVESGLRGGAQGLSLGYADEGYGAARGMFDDLKGLLSGDSSEPKPTRDEHGRIINADELTGTYQKHRDDYREADKRAREANPGTFTAGEIGGGIATAFIPGLGAAGSVGKMAATGAGLGGAAGLGASEADDFEGALMDAGKGIALGAGGGYVVGKGLPMMANGINKAGQGLKKFAEKKAFESLGGVKRATEKALEQGRLHDTGRYLLDEGIVTPLASKNTMSERVSSKLGKVSSEFDDTLNQVANSDALDPVQKFALKQAQFNPKQTAEIIKDELRAEFSHLPQDVLEPRLQMVDQWLGKNGSMSIKDAQAFKTQMQNFINDASYWKGNPNASQDTLMRIRRGIKEGIEDNADTFANITHEPTGKVKSLNQEMGKLLEADDILQDRISRDIANRSISLTDTISAGAGMASGNGLLDGGLRGLALGAANKLVRHRGDQLAATGADKLSKLLLRSPRMKDLATRNPAAFKALVNDVSRRISENGGGASKAAGSGFVSNPMSDEDRKRSFLEGN